MTDEEYARQYWEWVDSEFDKWFDDDDAEFESLTDE